MPTWIVNGLFRPGEGQSIGTTNRPFVSSRPPLVMEKDTDLGPDPGIFDPFHLPTHVFPLGHRTALTTYMGTSELRTTSLLDAFIDARSPTSPISTATGIVA